MNFTRSFLRPNIFLYRIAVKSIREPTSTNSLWYKRNFRLQAAWFMFIFKVRPGTVLTSAYTQPLSELNVSCMIRIFERNVKEALISKIYHFKRISIFILKCSVTYFRKVGSLYKGVRVKLSFINEKSNQRDVTCGLELGVCTFHIENDTKKLNLFSFLETRSTGRILEIFQ